MTFGNGPATQNAVQDERLCACRYAMRLSIAASQVVRTQLKGSKISERHFGTSRQDNILPRWQELHAGDYRRTFCFTQTCSAWWSNGDMCRKLPTQLLAAPDSDGQVSGGSTQYRTDFGISHTSSTWLYSRIGKKAVSRSDRAILPGNAAQMCRQSFAFQVYSTRRRAGTIQFAVREPRSLLLTMDSNHQLHVLYSIDTMPCLNKNGSHTRLAVRRRRAEDV